MKAHSPFDQNWYYFVDKCLPFGASRSCAIFQAVSDAIAYLVQKCTGKEIINYLDDFLFIAILAYLCNQQVQTFIDICNKIKLPVAYEKTLWSMDCLVFLGLLLDTVNQLILLLKEKIMRDRQLIQDTLAKKKITIKELQKLTGFLNFLGRAIVPGRTFTRRLYAYTKMNKWKPHHHIRLNQEMKQDLQMWVIFLHHPTIFSRPFADFNNNTLTAPEVCLYSDASRNFKLGFGAICQQSWVWRQWNFEFMEHAQPSIEYLELYAVLIAVTNWVHRFSNRRITLHCDNMSVVQMINSTSSTCKNCMVLIRKLTLQGLIHNVRIFAQYMKSKDNYFSDALSRLDFPRFWCLSHKHDMCFE